METISEIVINGETRYLVEDAHRRFVVVSSEETYSCSCFEECNCSHIEHIQDEQEQGRQH